MENNRLITNLQELEAVTRKLKGCPWLVLELATTGPNSKENSITGWALAAPGDSEVFYIPAGNLDLFEGTNHLPFGKVAEKICQLIDSKPLVGYDLTASFAFIEKLDWKPSLVSKSNVMVEAYITGRFPSTDLADLVKDLYGHELAENNEILTGVRRGSISIKNPRFTKIPTDNAWEYACERAFFIRKIHQDLYQEIVDEPKLKRLHQIEMDILPIAAEMQEMGLRIDSEKCRSEYERLMKGANALSDSFHGWLRRNFNITTHYDFGSSPQTAELLIDKLHILREVKTEKGNRSTSKKIFEGLRNSSPAVNAMYTYRELIKISSGFYGLYPKFKGPDRRIHPKLLTCHVVSGRTASADPNCQQIPKESAWEFIDFEDRSSDSCATCPDRACLSCTKAKKRILRTAAREVFMPRDGYIFIEADFSQIELMVLAGVAGETRMLEAFREGLDIHNHTASLIFSVPLDQVGKAQRRAGKTTNFRFSYGGGPMGLADQLGISFEQAIQINRAYSRAYPMINSFAEKSAREAFKNGYVETLFGRRRYMEEFKAIDSKMKARGRRLAVNLQIQGGAADIAKIGLVRQDRARREFDSKFSRKTYLVNFVHDSFLWEIPMISEDREKQTRFIEEFTESMRKALCFDVSALTKINQFPELKIDFKIGVNYHSMVGIDEWGIIANNGKGHEKYNPRQV